MRGSLAKNSRGALNATHARPRTDDEEAVSAATKPPSTMEVLGGRTRAAPAAPDALPLPKTIADLRRFSVMPSDHFNYAATWFTLSAATAALAVKAARQAPK